VYQSAEEIAKEGTTRMLKNLATQYLVITSFPRIILTLEDLHIDALVD
jgi:hypothetical protein